MKIKRIVLKGALFSALASLVACSGDEQTVEEPMTTANLQTDPALEAPSEAFSEFSNPTDSMTEQMADAAQQQETGVPQEFATLFVTAEYLNVRSGPYQTSPVVRVIKQGTQVENWGHERSVWLKISENEYASAKHLKNGQDQLAYNFIDQFSNPNAENYATTSGTETFKVAGTKWLRVRSAPSKDAQVVDKLPQNTPVAPLGNENGWVKIGEGQYVFGSYLKSSLAH